MMKILCAGAPNCLTSRFCAVLDTTSWSDTAKRAVALIDSYLMWNKLRQTPGGEELYRNTPGPVAPLLRGIGKYASGLLQGKTGHLDGRQPVAISMT
jgi:hypothetical protein